MNNKGPQYNRLIPDEEKLRRIIKEGNAEELNQYCDTLGKGLTYELWYTKGTSEKIIKEKELTRSQIRNILDTIQMMREFNKDKLQLLRPKLAYLAGRHGGRVKEFQRIIDKSILMVTNEKEFENFTNFVEAIVAYHRYHGGKD